MISLLGSPITHAAFPHKLACNNKGLNIFVVCQIDLPTAFWGLLGPRKDVTGDFIKTISMQKFLSFWYHWHGQRSPWGPKRPQKVKCVSFLLKQ